MQRPETPAVSVVMSVYNGEEYLAEAVESVLGQTFGDFEFLIIDDGSKDRTGEMLVGYARRDGRVRVITQENQGRVASLNRGMREANAAVIARMDADDVALPERFEKQVGFLRAHPEVGLLGGAVQMIAPDGRELGVFAPPTTDAELRATMVKWNPFRHPTIMMRKAAATAAGGYRKALLDTDDYDLWFRISEREQIANLADVILRYRTHPKQVSVTNMAHQMICCRAVIGAAQRRSRGLPDPLDGVEEITAEFVRGLGVSDDVIRDDIARGYCYWICTFANFQPEQALELLDALLRLKQEGPVQRRWLADSLLAAARIHLRRGNLKKGFAYAGQGIMMHPLAAGRVAKMAVARRVRDFNARMMHRSPA